MVLYMGYVPFIIQMQKSNNEIEQKQVYYLLY